MTTTCPFVMNRSWLFSEHQNDRLKLQINVRGPLAFTTYFQCSLPSWHFLLPKVNNDTCLINWGQSFWCHDECLHLLYRGWTLKFATLYVLWFTTYLLPTHTISFRFLSQIIRISQEKIVFIFRTRIVHVEQMLSCETCRLRWWLMKLKEKV